MLFQIQILNYVINFSLYSLAWSQLAQQQLKQSPNVSGGEAGNWWRRHTSLALTTATSSANQFCKVVSLMHSCRPDWAHFIEGNRDTPLCGLPGRFASRKPTTNDRNHATVRFRDTRINDPNKQINRRTNCFDRTSSKSTFNLLTGNQLILCSDVVTIISVTE